MSYEACRLRNGGRLNSVGSKNCFNGAEDPNSNIGNLTTEVWAWKYLQPHRHLSVVRFLPSTINCMVAWCLLKLMQYIWSWRMIYQNKKQNRQSFNCKWNCLHPLSANALEKKWIQQFQLTISLSDILTKCFTKRQLLKQIFF